MNKINVMFPNYYKQRNIIQIYIVLIIVKNKRITLFYCTKVFVHFFKIWIY